MWKTCGREIIDSEIEKLGYLFNDYKGKYEEFMSYPPGARDSMYLIDFEAKTSLSRWLDCLDKGGHVAKPGATLIYDPQIDRGEYMKAVGLRLSDLVQGWTTRQEHTTSPASGPGQAHSTPQYSGGSVWFLDETSRLTQVEALVQQLLT